MLWDMEVIFFYDNITGSAKSKNPELAALNPVLTGGAVLLGSKNCNYIDSIIWVYNILYYIYLNIGLYNFLFLIWILLRYIFLLLCFTEYLYEEICVICNNLDTFIPPVYQWSIYGISYRWFRSWK